MWTNGCAFLLQFQCYWLVLTVRSSIAQNYGSFFTAIYINSGSEVGSNQVSCGSMGYASYCCNSSQYCALDANSHIACCASGDTCSGSPGQAYNNGQYTQQSTQCECEGTTTAVGVIVTQTSYYVQSTANANCANKCGYYGQLCCVAGEYCFTNNNNQAQCTSSPPPTATATTVIGVYTTPTTATTTYVAQSTTGASNALVTITETAGATTPVSVVTIGGEVTTTASSVVVSGADSLRTPGLVASLWGLGAMMMGTLLRGEVRIPVR